MMINKINKLNINYELSIDASRPSVMEETNQSNSYIRQDIDTCDNQEGFALEVNSNESQENEIHKMHMLQSLQALQYLKTITPPPLSALREKIVFLPPFKGHRKKTLIFDMDETLIHCVDSIEDEDPQFIIKVPLDGEEVDAGINIRPYALECLEAVNQRFQVIVFTASHQSYADAVLDFLDPNHELIQKRLYRDSCYETQEGIYVKDLRIFANRKLSDLIIGKYT